MRVSIPCEITNPIRRALVDKISIALKAHAQRTVEDGLKFLYQALDFNREFQERSRGKGRNKPFIRSVADAKRNSTYFPPSKRGGEKECARRRALSY